MITIRELLNQVTFSDLTLLTNEDTLDKDIETIDVTETPDVANFTISNALILTTAMVFKDDQEALLDFIKSLNRVGVSGLCIKTSRFVKYINKDIINYANSVKFAIIEIPVGKTLGVLSHNMLDYILGKQTQNVLFALDIQKHYSNLFIDGASPQVILNELSNTIKAPAILINPFMDVIGHSAYFHKTKNPVGPYLDQISEQFDNLTTKIQSINIRDSRHEILQTNIYPIKANSSFQYYLIILHPNKLTYPIAQFAIDQSKMVLSFILYKNEQIENSMIRIQNSFFSKLLFGNPPEDRNDPEFFNQGLNHGLINTKYYRIILCEIVPDQNERKYDKEDLGLIIYQWLIERTIPTLKYGLVFYRDKTKSTSILLQHNVEDIEEKLKQSAQDIYDLLKIRIHFGLGKPVDHPYEIKNSYFEGVKALELENNDIVKHYRPSGLMTLFNRKDDDSINYFIKHQLKELVEVDDISNKELLETLKVYLDNQGEITKTAQEMFLHRNTITYRIKKCEEILDVNTKDSTTSLNLRLALHLLDTKV